MGGRPPTHAALGLLLLCLVAQWLLAGCSLTAQPPRANRTPTATSLPRFATATATPAPLPALSLRSAWGDVAISRLPTDLGDNRVFVFENTVTLDGQWLVGVSEPRDFLSNTTRLSYLTLYNIHTRTDDAAARAAAPAEPGDRRLD